MQKLSSPLPTDVMARNRRTFLSQSGIGLGVMALASLLGRRTPADVGTGAPASGLHHPAKVKRVIFLCMAGGPSHLETFDYKPELARLHDKPMPESFTKGQPIAQLQGTELKCLGPQATFGKHGESGQEISNFLPWHQKMADDICIVRSMVTEQINHDPAHTLMNTGTIIGGRPSMGAWINYGLGSECDDLPGFVVLTSDSNGRTPQPISSRQWGAGFLPSRFQGVPFNSMGDPVYYVSHPQGITPQQQQRLVETVNQLNQHRFTTTRDEELRTSIAAYEMAFRMQTSVPELTDLSGEPRHVLEMYGATPGDGSYASNCLLARRLAERGVRFIQLYHRDWDHHDHLGHFMNICCGDTDRATYALLTDLKQRGLLDDTLLIWGGEFGRTPMFQGTQSPGRDHHIKGFSMWLAGGGIRRGMTHGATDELGYSAVEDVVQIRDLHATVLHLLGIDHRRLTVKFQGLDMRLTGVEESHVVQQILT